MSSTELAALRHELHKIPELAFHEEATAKRVLRQLSSFGAEVVATDVAGNGILVRIGGTGKSVLLRADLDALPLHEATGLAYASTNGCHHACGHDGHMTMLLGALEKMAADPPCDVWALFQPAEEIGEGMAAALKHPKIPDFDAVFAIHNVPMQPLGDVTVRDGLAAVASTGIVLKFEGATSHAAEPERGRNPIPAVARLAQVLLDSPNLGDEHAVCSLAEIRGGAPRFGTSAGDCKIAATMRAGTDEALERMVTHVVETAQAEAKTGDFALEVERVEPFPATQNDSVCAGQVRRAAKKLGLAIADEPPFAWSEDFGYATDRWPGALIGLGSGKDQPPLHSPAYDFPDDLLAIGVDLWCAIAEEFA